MYIEFSTRDYEWTYGRKPRGYGYWAFFFEGYEFWGHGTFTEAKKACKQYIKSIAPADYVGTVIVNVGT